MSAVFDVLQAVNSLRDAGHTQQQAERTVAIVIDAVRSQAATKGDIQDLRNDIQMLETKLVGSMDGKFGTIDGQFDVMEAKIDALGDRLTVRLGGIMAGALTVHFGVCWLVFTNIFVMK